MSSSMGGGDEPSVSIGNYKGVMLCNRPFAGVSAAARKAGDTSDGKVPFKSAVINHEQLGLNPAARVHTNMNEGDGAKKDTALNRHKKWLHDMKKAKVRIQDEEEDRMQAKEDKQRKFMERQAELRAQVRQTMDGEIDAKDCEEEGGAGGDGGGGGAARFEEPQDDGEDGGGKYGDAGDEEDDRRLEQTAPAAREVVRESSKEEEQEHAVTTNADLSAAQRRKVKDNKKKPMWALTDEAREQLEDDEIDGLMDFAAELDIDKYLDDLEGERERRRAREREARACGRFVAHASFGERGVGWNSIHKRFGGATPTWWEWTQNYPHTTHRTTHTVSHPCFPLRLTSLFAYRSRDLLGSSQTHIHPPSHILHRHPPLQCGRRSRR